MYSNGMSINVAGYRSFYNTSSGFLSVPVRPSAVIYTQFDYVRGTPADNPSETVPLTKVQILNALITQLVNMKQNPLLSKNDLGGMSEEGKDEMIKQLQQQVKNAVTQTTSHSTYGFAGMLPESATLVSIYA